VLTCSLSCVCVCVCVCVYMVLGFELRASSFYYLSHTPQLFCYFLDMVLPFSLRAASGCDPLNYDYKCAIIPRLLVEMGERSH
jgi:hypothetical protein